MRTIVVVVLSVSLAVGLLFIGLLFFEAHHTGSGDDMRTAPAQTARVKPNIVFTLTDDLDKRLLTSHLSDYPNIRALAAHGVTFENAFVTNALCCPSRSTILTGLYSHNHHVMDNDPPNGGAPAFRPLEPKALPVWLDNAGYHTALIGNYLNEYDGTYVPPGWDEWQALPDDDPVELEAGHGTDLFSEQADEFVRNHSRPTPFYLQVGTHAPHEPAMPYARHADLFPDEKTPQPPSFDEADVSDKPGYIRTLEPLTHDKVVGFNELYRNRLRSMMAVDEMVGRIVAALREEGELSNTYVVFSSDNGFQMGQHRLVEGKRLAYEEGIRVPLIVRGPGVPADVTRSGMVLNNDLASTFAQWAQATPLLAVDGRSLVPLLKPSPPSGSAWRTAFVAEASRHERIHRPAYRAVRTKNYIFVRYGNGEKELYNLERDPNELRSRDEEASRSLKERLGRRLSTLDDCRGTACRRAEGP